MRKRALLVLSNGVVMEGYGFGAEKTVVAEVCFHTGMTGYQEIMSDPSYAEQIVCFTFPHVGIPGVNLEDRESDRLWIKGVVVKDRERYPSNCRSEGDVEGWLREEGVPGIEGIDTRRLTLMLREEGFLKGLLTTEEDMLGDESGLLARVRAWEGLEGLDLAGKVGAREGSETWDRGGSFFGRGGLGDSGGGERGRCHVVVVDYGCKHMILRKLVDYGCRVTLVGARATFGEIEALKPDGVVLSNGPGDPAATGAYAVSMIGGLLESGLPILGICLGHQLLSLSLGLSTKKMKTGHHGANHPVLCLGTGEVKITSQNHGFDVDASSIPESVEVCERSLFDGSVAALKVKDRPIFSVQYHPEASPGPRETGIIFGEFVEAVKRNGVPVS
jgi:carbamoyl-phosphate synthase small subunit